MNFTPLFTVANKEVVVSDLSTGRVIWSGCPLDRDVVDLVQLDLGPRAVVLLEMLGSPPDDRANLVAIDSLGRLLWKAELPTRSSTDGFTSVDLTENGVSAFSWSGHRVVIDPETGRTISGEFTK
jgi:hypothetical protein